jgi:hypothetical protein
MLKLSWYIKLKLLFVICVVCESDMQQYHICGVMVGVLTSNAGQTNNYKIGVCCFSSKYTALRRKSKDWLAGNQDNVAEWADMSISGLLFQ